MENGNERIKMQIWFKSTFNFTNESVNSPFIRFEIILAIEHYATSQQPPSGILKEIVNLCADVIPRITINNEILVTF